MWTALKRMINAIQECVILRMGTATRMVLACSAMNVTMMKTCGMFPAYTCHCIDDEETIAADKSAVSMQGQVQATTDTEAK